MLYLFIDTNVLLRFYAYSDDDLAEVEKLSALIRTEQIRLVVTEQIIDEHARNRDKVLSDSLKRLEQITVAAQMPRFAQHHEHAKLLSEAMRAAKIAKGALIDAINAEMNDDGLRADRVILEIFASTPSLPRTHEVITRARLRRELQNPPGKPDSLGDQINWELLLENVPAKADLHVISKDGDFGGGNQRDDVGYFLRREWKTKKEANLFLYQGLSSFTKAHFPHIKAPSDALKSGAIGLLTNAGNYGQTHSAIAQLSPILEDLSTEEALAILVAVTQNNQISDVIHEHDVSEFFSKLYLRHWGGTSVELDRQLQNISKEAFLNPLF